MHSVLSGRSHAAEVNAVVGQLWLLTAKLDVSLRLGRVESKANIADGPSRDNFEWVHALGAQFVEPIVPEWLADPWVDPICEMKSFAQL